MSPLSSPLGWPLWRPSLYGQLIIFFDNKGIVHKEFVLAGQTVNFAYYCDVLRQLRKNARRVRPEL
jgi:hypothetical protein